VPPRGLGMPFLDINTCTGGQGWGVVYQGFLACMMPWMDDRTNGWTGHMMKKTSRKTTTTSFTICNYIVSLPKQPHLLIVDENDSSTIGMDVGLLDILEFEFFLVILITLLTFAKDFFHVAFIKMWSLMFQVSTMSLEFKVPTNTKGKFKSKVLKR